MEGEPVSGRVGLGVLSDHWHSGAPEARAHGGDMASQVTSAGITPADGVTHQKMVGPRHRPQAEGQLWRSLLQPPLSLLSRVKLTFSPFIVLNSFLGKIVGLESLTFVCVCVCVRHHGGSGF